jgi:hypothetical protein
VPIWAVAALALIAAPALGQSVTRPPVERKIGSETGADEVVARLVYAPVKQIGLGQFTSEGQIALKALMDRIESRVREVVTRWSEGTLDDAGARRALAHVLADYRDGLSALRRER